jgi:hypothetical protein
VLGELIGNLLAWASIAALIAFFVRPKPKAVASEQRKWSVEEKETFRNLINKRD